MSRAAFWGSLGLIAAGAVIGVLATLAFSPKTPDKMKDVPIYIGGPDHPYDCMVADTQTSETLLDISNLELSDRDFATKLAVSLRVLQSKSPQLHDHVVAAIGGGGTTKPPGGVVHECPPETEPQNPFPGDVVTTPDQIIIHIDDPRPRAQETDDFLVPKLTEYGLDGIVIEIRKALLEWCCAELLFSSTQEQCATDPLLATTDWPHCGWLTNAMEARNCQSPNAGCRSYPTIESLTIPPPNEGP